MLWFHALYPAFMILSPALFLGLWCYLTGVKGMRPMLVATLVVFAVYVLCVWLLPAGVTASGPFVQLWALGGLLGLLWGLGVPVIRRAFAALPEAPRVISLQPRKVELSTWSKAWPFLVWLALTLSLLFAPDRGWMTWLGPALGFCGLVLLRFVLPYMVQEPEPTGGPDPEGLARRQAEFRRQRTRTMHWLMVVLNLFCTGLGWFSGELGAWVAALAGCLIGLWGALFGTWADARRYLLRKELASAPEVSSPA